MLIALLLRVSLVYVVLLVLIRLSGKRRVAESSAFDVVVALMVGDTTGDVIVGEVLVLQGLVALATVVLLHMLVTAAAARSRLLDRLVRARPALLLMDGHPGPRARGRERMNETDLDTALRHQGIADRRDVQEARLESNGDLSIAGRADARPLARRDRRRWPGRAA